MAAALAMAVCSAGCGPRAAGAPGGAKPPSAFPTQAALAAVAKAPPPALGSTDDYVQVGSWPLTGPFPDAVAARAASTGDEPWVARLHAAVAARAGVTLATQGMACTARQLALFLLEHDKLPAPSLRAFMAARCGAVASSIALSWIAGTAPAVETDAQVHAAWEAQLAPMYASLPLGNAEVGVWMVRKGEKVVVLLAAGQRRVLLDAVTPLADQPGVHVLQAELLEPAASVRVMVNRGRFGFAECAVRFEAPAIEARCPADVADEHAWISVAAFPAGRVLGDRVLDVLVWPRGTAVDTYTHVPVGEQPAVTDGAGVSRGLLAAMNEVRKTAGLAPVTEEAAQSATAAEVAPYYFAAQEGALEETVADVVALGLRAGWQVTGLVRESHFAAPMTLGSEQVGDLVALAIEHPFGRQTLLDPLARTVSLGGVWAPESKFMGAVITTYTLLDAPPPALADRVFERLAEARKVASRSPPTRDGRLDAEAAEVRALLLAGDIDADAALRRFMGAYASGVSGYWLEMTDPETMTLPPALVGAQNSKVAIVVARHRRADHPWACYVVFVLADGLVAEMNI